MRAIGLSISRTSPFGLKPDNPDQSHDFRSDHDRLFHPGNVLGLLQDR